MHNVTHCAKNLLFLTRLKGRRVNVVNRGALKAKTSKKLIIKGLVVPGRQQGRHLGFPTASPLIHGNVYPKFDKFDHVVD